MNNLPLPQTLDLMLNAHCIAETEDYAVVFKPPRMHCAPLRQGKGDTLLDWYAEVFPPVLELSGRKKGEGGLLHRLDFETQGLVLFAKTQQSLDNLLEQQEKGNFIKEYSAICQKEQGTGDRGHEGFFIESFFRPFGPGRKQVRPLTENGKNRKNIATDKGAYYRTEIINVEECCREGFYRFTIRVKRGFRHQIRCHLAWIACPILNDPLYGMGNTDGFLALRAHGLFFSDPQSSRSREYCIAPLEMPSEMT